MFNINLPGLPDFSNLIIQRPQGTREAAIAPSPIVPVAPAPVPVPEFDPYAGMTPADLAEIGVFISPPAMVAPPVQTPAPAPAPVQPAPSMGIEGLAPNFAMTEDFALPVGEPPIPMPVPQPVVQTPAPAPIPTPAPQPVAPAPAFDPYAAMTQADLAEMGNPLAGRDFIIQRPQGTREAAIETSPIPTPEVVEPVLATTPAFDPYEGMTQADLVEMGNPLAGRDFIIQRPQGTREAAIETSPIVTAAPEPATTAVPNVANVAQSLVPPVASDFYTDGQMEALGIEPGTLTTPSGRVIDEVRSREDVYVPPRDYITAASDYYTDGQLADMGMEPGTAVSTGANPQQSAGTPLNLTPEQQAALDAFIANNPGGTVIGTPFGNVSLPDLSNYTGGGGSPSTNTRAMDFVIQNLAPVEREAYDPRVATQYAASALPPTPQRGNPFRRPEDQGIASLVPSGG